jgi:hypothetical protein
MAADRGSVKRICRPAERRQSPSNARPAATRHVFLMLAVWVLSFPNAGSSLRAARCAMRRELPHFLAALGCEQTVMLPGGRGFACWRVAPDGSWYVDYLMCFPRGRGHGTELLRSLIGIADDRQRSLVLHAEPQLSSWYQGHGFRRVRPAGDARDAEMAAGGLVKLRRLPVVSRA